MLEQARSLTDSLFGLLHTDALYERPIAERHRLIFYVGHLEAFDWNLLRSGLPGVESVSPQLDRLFAFGIDPVGGNLPSDEISDWPSVSEIQNYSARIRNILDNAKHDDQAIRMAVEHRLMHAETLAYMVHQLPLSAKRTLIQPQIYAPDSVPGGMAEIPAGRATLGLQRGRAFGWDKEFDEHQVDVAAFAIDRFKVTNREFLRFVESGGYDDRDLWNPEAWRWKTEQQITGPTFWRRLDGVWNWQAMFDTIPLPLTWPVYVSHAEASAYARWIGMRLPTEAEWQRAAYGCPDSSERPFPWGNEAPTAEQGFFDFARWDPSPVHAFPAGRSAFGLEGLIANGWEWTATLFAPFNGFRAHPLYTGYSADFFDDHHYVLKGGSPRTAASMLRRSFRNWFQPCYQYVYAGFRCARDI